MAKPIQPFKDLVSRLKELDPQRWAKTSLSPNTIQYATQLEGTNIRLQETLLEGMPKGTARHYLVVSERGFNMNITGRPVHGLYHAVDAKYAKVKSKPK